MMLMVGVVEKMKKTHKSGQAMSVTLKNANSALSMIGRRSMVDLFYLEANWDASCCSI